MIEIRKKSAIKHNSSKNKSMTFKKGPNMTKLYQV